MTAERWLPVVGYEGWYDISSYGRVRRMKAYNNTFVGRILKEALDSRGYMFVLLSKKGVIGHFTIQWLVTEAFLGSRTDGKEVNHKDGVKENNHVNNLEWTTSSENSKHAYKIGLCIAPYLGKFGKDHNTSKQISQYDKSMTFLNTFESASLAKIKTGISHIDGCARGERKTAGGFIWKYINK